MRRITKENINTPEFFDNHFSGELQYADIDRLEKLVKYFKGGRYAEIGCFDSPMPIILADRFPTSEIYAFDFSKKVVATWGPRFPKIHWGVADVRNLPLEDESIDYVMAGEIIEHMDEPETFIGECMRVLAKGGWLAISTPLNESDRREVGGKQHLWSFSEQDFKDWGFETEIMNKTIIAWKRK